MRFLLLLLLGACRFSWSESVGTPAARSAMYVLYAGDAPSSDAARAVLRRDPRARVVDLDASVIDRQRSECTSAACEHAIACTWSVRQGATYYARVVAAADTGYAIDVYDAKTCAPVPALSQRLAASGAAEPSTSSAPEPNTSAPPGPDATAATKPSNQITVGVDGRIVGAAFDGDYVHVRGGEDQGVIRVRDAGTQDERLHPLYCCLTPAPGDTLIARGRRHFLDLAPSATTAVFSGHAGFGGGVHLRYYALDGGLQLGAGVDFVADNDDFFAAYGVEAGWGWTIRPGFIASFNVGILGAWRSIHDPSGDPDLVKAGSSRGVEPMLRLQSFLSRHWFAALDAGVIVTGDFEKMSSGSIQPGALIPIMRLSLGLDLDRRPPREITARRGR